MVGDKYIDRRVFVNKRGNDGRGHIGLGNPISITNLINDVVIPNIPALSVLPYRFENGLTEIVGTPSTVGLGGNLINNTSIVGVGVELELSIDSISNYAIDYLVDSDNYRCTSTYALDIVNNALRNSCGLAFYLQSQLELPVTIGADLPTVLDGSKMTIEGIQNTLNIASGYYNIVENCSPYSTMQRSYIDSINISSGVASVTTDNSVDLYYDKKDTIINISSRINLEDVLLIEVSDFNNSLSQKIILPNNAAPSFLGVNPTANSLYKYEFPNTTPNNGDVMISDNAGKLQYEAFETHISAYEKITGAVGQTALFIIPFVKNHVCTRISFSARVSSNPGLINFNIINTETGGSIIESEAVSILNTSPYTSYSINLTGATIVSAPQTLGIRITGNTQPFPALTDLYFTMTFVRSI